MFQDDVSLPKCNPNKNHLGPIAFLKSAKSPKTKKNMFGITSNQQGRCLRRSLLFSILEVGFCWCAGGFPWKSKWFFLENPESLKIHPNRPNSDLLGLGLLAYTYIYIYKWMKYNGCVGEYGVIFGQLLGYLKCTIDNRIHGAIVRIFTNLLSSKSTRRAVWIIYAPDLRHIHGHHPLPNQTRIFTIGGCSRAVWDHMPGLASYSHIRYQASSCFTLLRDSEGIKIILAQGTYIYTYFIQTYWLSTTMTIP